MTWFAFSLLSILVLALAELAQQYLLHTKKYFDERTSVVLTFLIQSILTIPIIFFSGLKARVYTVFLLDTFPFILLVTLISSFAMIFYLRSFKVNNISISSIFVSLSTVVSTSMGVVFFNEGIYLYKVLGIVLVLLAIISLNVKNLSLEKNHFYGLVAGALFGIAYTLDKKIVQSVDPIIYIFWVFTLVAFFGFLFNPKAVIDMVKNARFEYYRPILISGIGYFLYNFFTFSAYKVGGEVGRVDAINNSQVFLIILVEYFIIRHKDNISRKLISAGIAFTGVMILGFI